MFTGLVLGTCKVVSIDNHLSGMDACFQYDFSQYTGDVTEGTSVSLNGACSTIVSFDSQSFKVQFLKETLKKTTFDALKEGDLLNVEWCATPTTALGGHIVSGHVDDVGFVKEWSWGDEWGRLTIGFDPKWANNLVYKGSVTIDGMSLTVAELGEDWLTCFIIPHTQAITCLHTKKAGDKVNLEFDMIGKYVQKYMTNAKGGQS